MKTKITNDQIPSKTNKTQSKINQDSANIIFNKDSDKFPYKEIEFSTFDLLRHHEFPQGLFWHTPKFSQNGKFIGAICSNDQQKDILNIWELNEKENEYYLKYTKENEKILTFDFISSFINQSDLKPTTLSFVVIPCYPQPISNYNIKSGKLINHFKTTKEISSFCDSLVSRNGKYYTLATKNEVIVFQVIKGEQLLLIENDSENKFLIDTFLISISLDGIITLIDTVEPQKNGTNFEIQGVKSFSEILACTMSSDHLFLYYVLGDGTYKINTKSKNTIKIIPFIGINTEQVKAFISPDCKRIMTTDLSTIYIWEEQNKEITTSDDNSNMNMILRQSFSHITVSFFLYEILTIDDYRINISSFAYMYDDVSDDIKKSAVISNSNHIEERKDQEDEDYTTAGVLDINIYLNKNMNSITWFQFSSDNKTLLTIIDTNNAAIWNCQTGKLIRKWHNESPMWYKTVKMSPDESELSLISTKTTDNLIQLWDFATGNEFAPLAGFNAFTIEFSNDGYLVAAGAFEGKEVANVWKIEDPSNALTYFYDTPASNVHVGFTPDSSTLICVPNSGSPLLFDVETSNLIKKIDIGYNLNCISNLKISSDGNYFHYIGLRIKTYEGNLFDIHNLVKLRTYINCVSMDFSLNSKYLLIKIVNVADQKENKLTIYKVINKEFIPLNIPIDVEKNYLLQDNKVLCSIIPGQKEKIFVLSDIETGKMLGEAVYKETDENKKYAVDLVINKDSNNLLLRRFAIEDCSEK